MTFNSLCSVILGSNALDLFLNFWDSSLTYMLHWSKCVCNCLSRSKTSSRVKEHSGFSSMIKMYHVYRSYTAPQVPSDLNFPGMICSPIWLTVPTRMFLLLLVVCPFWMYYMWISVSAALFGDWPRGYNPGQSIFAELGCSSSIALSCLSGLISVSDSVFSFLFGSSVLLGLAKTKGPDTMPRLNLDAAELLLRDVSLLSTSNKISGIRLSPIHLKCTFGPGSNCAQQSWREWLSF